MSFPATLPPTRLLPQTQRHQLLEFRSLNLSTLKFASSETHRLRRLRASRRAPNFPQGNGDIVDDTRNWSRSIEFGTLDEDDDDNEEEEEEEEDRSLDLMIKFVQNVFKKVSRRARRAVRSVLPVAIPTKLVGFSVNGVLILAVLWGLKALLEVVCTLGSVVFASILFIQGAWTGVIYLQDSRNRNVCRFEDENNAWNGAQPAA